MIIVNVEKLLKRNQKTKYWLCQNMNITYKNLNRIIDGETKSISFKYLEDFCKYLDCSVEDLLKIEK